MDARSAALSLCLLRLRAKPGAPCSSLPSGCPEPVEAVIPPANRAEFPRGVFCLLAGRGSALWGTSGTPVTVWIAQTGLRGLLAPWDRDVQTALEGLRLRPLCGDAGSGPPCSPRGHPRGKAGLVRLLDSPFGVYSALPPLLGSWVSCLCLSTTRRLRTGVGLGDADRSQPRAWSGLPSSPCVGPRAGFRGPVSLGHVSHCFARHDETASCCNLGLCGQEGGPRVGYDDEATAAHSRPTGLKTPEIGKGVPPLRWLATMTRSPTAM
jgi:hypothetical protein